MSTAKSVQSIWLSTEKVTFCIKVDEHGIIRFAAPIARRFVGQPYENILRWLRPQGGLEITKMPPGGD